MEEKNSKDYRFNRDEEVNPEAPTTGSDDRTRVEAEGRESELQVERDERRERLGQNQPENSPAEEANTDARVGDDNV